MNNETLDYFLPQVQSDIGDLVHYSTHLGQLLCKYGLPFEGLSTRTLEEQSSELYTEARKLGDDLPFSTLAVYVAAFADILEERLK
ncbi:hypothetical protein [Candidatus Contendibacter odensensis]|uniref:Uncharacterized protein n=1 Tax=Candidatus Contendobacter odensis Run_B_J11 TaxID=1400861 RepID=A0A7U7G8Q4_9GAMM|nr:hypothetical protein [Candidatus Contendobacter odensis]CDH43650.1 hypothetical protein BN874_1270009 [Candidatus Contendobacter odensis Run_B_J11]